MISKKEAVERIQKTNGRIFSVVFEKKDGTLREMVCRLGVKKYVTGVGMSYDPSKYNLLPVFDMEKHDYRMIRLDEMRLLKIDGQQFEVEM